MSPVPVRIVKVGGSLLDVEDLGERLRNWLDQQSPARNVLVVGGGQFIDEIRRLDRVHRIHEATIHQLCLFALGVTGRLLASILPISQTVSQLADFDRISACGGPALMDTELILRELDQSSHTAPLPSSWRVTSDSIAAHIAEAVHATELALLKSTDPPQPASVRNLQAKEYFDAHFLAAAGNRSVVRCVNFRDPGCPQWHIDLAVS